MRIQTSRQFLAKLAARRRFRASTLLPLTTAIITALLASNSAYAVDYTKADNTTALGASGSYTTTGTPTTSADRAIFDSTISAANEASLTTGSFALGAFVFQTLNGPVGISINSGSTVTLGGISGDIIDMTAATQDVTFSGSGTLKLGKLTGQQNFDVAAGRTLTIGVGNIISEGNSDTLGLIGAGSIIVNTSINAGTTNPLGLNINGANVTLNGSNLWNPNSSATFALTSGTLNLGNDNALQTVTGNTKQFTIAGGTLSASGGAHNVVTNGGFLITNSFAVSGTNNLTLGSNIANSTGTNTITNNMTGGAVFNLGGSLDLTNSGGTNRNLIFAGAGNTTLSGVVSNGTSTGVGSLTYSGSGTLTLSNANTFTGTTTISSGTLDLANALALQSSTLTPSGGSIVFDSVVTGNAFTLGGLSGSPNLALQNNAGTPAAIALTVGANNASTTYSGVLSAGGSLTKTGTGTLILTGANTYSGGTTISAGTLQLGDGSTANGSVVGNITDNGTLGFANPNAQTYASVISGNGALLKTGAGTLTLTGANTFTGLTTISAGTLQLGDSSTTNGSVAGNITDNATLIFANPSAQAYAGFIGGTGAVTKSGAGTLTLSGANAYTGTTSITAGTVAIGNATALGSSRVNLTAGATIDLNGSNLKVDFLNNGATLAGGVVDNVSAGGNVTLTVGGNQGGVSAASGTYQSIDSFSGVIQNTTGTVGLTKVSPSVASQSFGIISTSSNLNGGDVLRLTNQNTYTGATTVKGGILDLQFGLANNGGAQVNSNIISASSALVLAGGALIADSQTSGATTNQTFASLTLNAGGSQIGNYRPTSGSGTTALNAITRNVGSTVNFQDRPQGSSSNARLGAADGTDTTKTANANFTGGSATILGGYSTFNGITWAVSASNGTTAGAISGLATASYATALTAGTNVDVPAAGLTSGAVLTLNSLRFLNTTAGTTTAYNLTLGGNLTVATGGILVAGASATSGSPSLANATISGNFNLTSGNGQDLIFITSNLGAGGASLATMTVTSNITNNGATSIGLTKSGAGTLTLTPATANTFTGQLTINAGTVVLGTTNALNGNDVVFGGSTEIHGANVGGSTTTGSTLVQNGTLNLNGNNNTVGSLTSSTDSSGTAIVQDASATNATLTVSGSTNATYAGLIQNGTGGGTLGLTKNGANTQILTNVSSSFTGDVNIGGGILAVNASNNSTNPTTSGLGNVQVSRNINVNNGGTLRFDNGDTFGGAASTIASTLVINAGGTVTNNGSSYTTLGPITLNGGTLTGSGGSGNTQFQMYGFGGDVTVAGSSASTISGTGGTNGYHLGTSASGRTGTTFNVGVTGAIGGDLLVSAPLIDRTGGLGAASLTKTGLGTMVLSGTNTYTGATTVSSGTLLVNGSTASGSAVTVNGSGAVLGGTGTVGGTVGATNGTILAGAATSGVGTASATGTAVGTLTTGALTLTSTSVFSAVLAGDSSVSTLSASGTTALAGTFSITLPASGAPFAATGEALQLITSPITGAFTNSTYSTGGYIFTEDNNLSGSGGFYVDVTAVPEPTTVLSGLLMVAALGWSQRRRLQGWLALARA